MGDGVVKRPGQSRFLSNTVALVVQTIVTTLLTLIQVKILANWLGKEVFGAFVSLRGFSLLLSIVAANGLPNLLVRFVPAHEADDNYSKARWLSVASLGSASAILVLLAFIVVTLKSRVFGFAGVEVPGTPLLLWFFATTVGVALKMVLYGGFNGLRRLGAQLWLETATQSAILIWLVLERSALDIVVLFRILGVVHLATLLLGLPFYFLSLRGRGRSEAAQKNYPYRDYLRWSVLMSVVAVAFSDVDRYLLAQVLSLELLALFHIGARVSRLANRLLGVPTLAFQPEVTRLDSEGREEAVATAAKIFMKFTSVLAIVVTAAIALFGREVIMVIANAGYVEATVLLIILAISLPLSTATAPLTCVMKARDQIRDALWTDVAWAASYVVGMFSLAPSLGLVGVGLANLLACVVQLSTALMMSRLAIGWGFVVGLLLRLSILAIVVFLPGYVVGLLDVSSQLLLVFRFCLFLMGCVAMHMVLVRSRIPVMGGLYSQEERLVLRSLLERGGLSFARRLV